MTYWDLASAVVPLYFLISNRGPTATGLGGCTSIDKYYCKEKISVYNGQIKDIILTFIVTKRHHE
jgi:hypothetical protein